MGRHREKAERGGATLLKRREKGGGHSSYSDDGENFGHIRGKKMRGEKGKERGGMKGVLFRGEGLKTQQKRRGKGRADT